MPTKTKKQYDNDWPIVAICYDFDKTLSPKDMQNFSLIPKLNCTVEEFWPEANANAKKEGMDKILSYMKLIIDKAKISNVRITKKDFKKLGKDIELFPGVETWFERINSIGNDLNVNIEHYIISAGIKEILDGTSIAKEFKAIYASSFIFDSYGAPQWPRQIINYTTKTQYLFRISKNCLDLSDEEKVNQFIEDENRRIPFRNFIYIGDSETDIPAMKVVKNGGGTSIGVYNPETINIDRVSQLLKQERIDYLMPADYTEGSRIETIVKNVLNKIKSNEILVDTHEKQDEFVSALNMMDELLDRVKEMIADSAIEESDISGLRGSVRYFIRRFKKDISHDFGALFTEQEIDTIFKNKEKELMTLLSQKSKQFKTQKVKVQNGKTDQTTN